MTRCLWLLSERVVVCRWKPSPAKLLLLRQPASHSVDCRHSAERKPVECVHSEGSSIAFEGFWSVFHQNTEKAG